MAIADLAEAAEAFLHHFLGKKNWVLWTQLREKHGFQTNKDFASWMLQIIQEMHISERTAKQNHSDAIDETNNNKRTSMNNNIDRFCGRDKPVEIANGLSDLQKQKRINTESDVFNSSDEYDKVKIIDDHSALNLSNMLSSRDNLDVNNIEQHTERLDKITKGASSQDTRVSLSIDKMNDMNESSAYMYSDDDDDDDNEVDKPLNVQQFNKGGVRPKTNIEQICCTTCCRSFPNEALYNSHACSRNSKDRRKSSEPSKFVAPNGLDDDDDDSIGLYDAGSVSEEKANINGSLHGCNVCSGIFSSIEALKLHACKLRVSIPSESLTNANNGHHYDQNVGDPENLDESPLSVDYWNDDGGTNGALDFSNSDFLSANGKICSRNGGGESDSEMEGIVGSSNLSQSGVSSSSPDPRLVPCNMCGKLLMGNRAVIRHIRTVHMRIRKFHCSVCDRRFARNEHLKRHKCSRRSRISL